MEQNKQQRIRELTDRLNRCRYEYYNLNAPSLTDAEYDALFDELSTLEKETGFSMTNSPTQTVAEISRSAHRTSSAVESGAQRLRAIMCRSGSVRRSRRKSAEADPGAVPLHSSFRKVTTFRGKLLEMGTT